MKVSAVVFDIGNVLIGWTPEQFFDAKIGADRRQAFFDAVPILAANAAIDRGSPFPDTIVQLVDQHPDWEAEITLWHTCWLDMVSPEITRSVRLLRALRRQGIPVFALSNFGAETFEIAKARYMTGGQMSMPLVIRTANGGGSRFGAQHSQSVENWAMMIPGLKVVAPSSPADVKGLLAA
ncbi:MAG: hypothetical protein QNL63_17180, partial [Paracoccaceae bacterium]